MSATPEIPDLTPEALDRFKAAHVKGKHRNRYCRVCTGRVWPCPMVRSIAMYEREREERKLWEERAEMGVNHLELLKEENELLCAGPLSSSETYACQRCGRRDGLDAVAPNAMWAAITEGTLAPSGEVVDGRWSILCLWCMDALTAEVGISFSVSLHFAGRALFGTSQSDADRDHIARLTAARDSAR